MSPDDSAGSPASEARTGFYIPAAAALHDTGWGHPEHQGRLRAVASAVERRLPVLHGKVEMREAASATRDQLLAVHPSEYLDGLRAVAARAEREGAQVLAGPETPFSGASWRAIIESSGAAIEAVDRVASGSLRNAFVATRPPGHHASEQRAMGFCAVNHVAVAARHVQRSGAASRVAVVDWDVHHGNGTQDIFYSDPSVFYLSLHQWPLFPGTGRADEHGSGSAEGTTLNVPIQVGTESEAYISTFEASIDLARRSFDPDFILISAGYDALAGDPLGGLRLEPEDFAKLTKIVLSWAEEVCGGRVVALLEGGYEPRRTGHAVAETLTALT